MHTRESHGLVKSTNTNFYNEILEHEKEVFVHGVSLHLRMIISDNVGGSCVTAYDELRFRNAQEQYY